MESGGIEASESPFWAMVELLRREPGLGWLPRGLGGPAGPRGLRGEEAGEANQAPRKLLLGPRPLKALMLLEDSRDSQEWQVYYEGLKTFLAFRGGMSSSAVDPVPVDQVRKFLVNMESLDLPPAKIVMYMEGLSFISRVVGNPDPLQDPDICGRVSRLRSRTGPSDDKCSPVTIEVLRLLLGTLESVCSCPYECLLFRAMFTAAFFGALRVEEMVVTCSNRAQPKLLQRRDLQLTAGTANLCLHTPHRGRERHLIRLRLTPETWVCPVEALRVYVAARPEGEGPLFVHWNSRAVTKRQFLRVFRRALRIAGLPPKQFGVHSFWLGTAAAAPSRGCSDEAAKRTARL